MSLKEGEEREVRSGYNSCPLKSVELIIREGQGRLYSRNRKNGGENGEYVRMEIDQANGDFDDETMEID